MNTIGKISKERLEEIKAFQTTDYTDCPELTEEQLKNMKPSHLRGIYKPIKKEIQVKLDEDIIEWLNSSSKGIQTRMNNILREAMLKEEKIKN